MRWRFFWRLDISGSVLDVHVFLERDLVQVVEHVVDVSLVVHRVALLVALLISADCLEHVRPADVPHHISITVVLIVASSKCLHHIMHYILRSHRERMRFRDEPPRHVLSFV